jgi:hypothetical protein
MIRLLIRGSDPNQSRPDPGHCGKEGTTTERPFRPAYRRDPTALARLAGSAGELDLRHADPNALNGIARQHRIRHRHQDHRHHSAPGSTVLQRHAVPEPAAPSPWRCMLWPAAPPPASPSPSGASSPAASRWPSPPAHANPTPARPTTPPARSSPSPKTAPTFNKPARDAPRFTMVVLSMCAPDSDIAIWRSDRRHREAGQLAGRRWPGRREPPWPERQDQCVQPADARGAANQVDQEYER